MNPSYPIYIVSKGRWESRLTAKALERRRVPYSIVVEPQEYDQYAAVIDPARILVLPFANLGQGSIPARNWIWEHALATGAARHWCLDDNIRHFYRLHENRLWHTTSGTPFKAIEDYVDRYTNLALAGMQYRYFLPLREDRPPFTWNTRIYSCILILNELPFRWRGRYNEDTDLSLRALKAGWTTVLFNAFPMEKVGTLEMRGGNTDELYRGNGRLLMALSLREQHPDVTRVAWKWHRWQHVVDYRPFQQNQPILRPGAALPLEPNEYGLKLFQLDPAAVPARGGPRA